MNKKVFEQNNDLTHFYFFYKQLDFLLQVRVESFDIVRFHKKSFVLWKVGQFQDWAIRNWVAYKKMCTL